MAMTSDSLDLRQAIMNADKTVVAAVEDYLRMARKGGMPKERADQVLAVIQDAARLCYFSVSIADTCQG